MKFLEMFKGTGGQKAGFEDKMTVEDVDRKISAWRRRADEGNADEAMKVAKECKPFFEAMQRKSPGLYDLFRSQRNSLSETLLEKTSGQKVTID